MKYLLALFLLIFVVACTAEKPGTDVPEMPDEVPEQPPVVISSYRFSQITETVLTFEQNSDLGALTLNQEVQGTAQEQRILEEVQIETRFLGVGNAPELTYYQDGEDAWSQQAQGTWRSSTHERDVLELATEYAERTGFTNDVARPTLTAEELLTLVFVPQSRQTLSLNDVSRIDVQSSEVTITQNAGRIAQMTIDASLYYQDDADNLLVDVTHVTTFSNHNAATVQRPAGLP